MYWSIQKAIQILLWCNRNEACQSVLSARRVNGLQPCPFVQRVGVVFGAFV